ncbi:hypothetical protein BDR05DRAFT_842159, partial [Suillus weaverae]
MNTKNTSTGFSNFQLQLGRQPRMMPPLVNTDTPSATGTDEERARSLLSQLECDVMDAQDHLFAAKAAQATQVNKTRAPTHVFQAGDRVLLATKHCRREYIQKGDKRVAK